MLNLQRTEMSEKTAKRKVKYTKLGSRNTQELEDLLKGYKEDPRKARIKLLMKYNGGTTNKPESTRIVVFHKNKKDWSIVSYIRRWGISKTFKLYSHERLNCRLTFNSNGLWLVRPKGKVKSFAMNDLSQFNEGLNGGCNLVQDELIKRLPFMELFTDMYYRHILFSTIRNKKLYNLKRVVRHVYCISYTTLKRIQTELPNRVAGILDPLDWLKPNIQFLKNVDNIKTEWVDSKRELQTFNDAMRLAKVLNKQINCSWSTRRLNDEHVRWSNEIAEILYKGDQTPLHIDKLFTQFAEASGYDIAKTSDELFILGVLQRHCVATYTPMVNNGECAIYNIDGTCLELRNKSVTVGEKPNDVHEIHLYIAQFRGHKNQLGCPEVKAEIQDKLDEFNGRNRKPKKELNSYQKFLDKIFNTKKKIVHNVVEGIGKRSPSLFDNQPTDDLPF